MNVSRRNLLSTAGGFIACLPFLDACTTSQVAAALPQYAQDATTIANGLEVALTQLKTVNGVPPATLTQIGGYITDMQSVAAAISNAASASAALPSVQQLEADVNGAVSAAAALGSLLPPPVSTALQAAAVLLPVVETGVGLVVNAVKPTTGATMTPAQARGILNGLASK